MLIGVSGLLPGDWKTIDTSVLNKAKALGFKTVQVRVSDPQSATESDFQRLKSMYRDSGF